jgi:hypothetical protein
MLDAVVNVTFARVNKLHYFVPNNPEYSHTVRCVLQALFELQARCAVLAQQLADERESAESRLTYAKVILYTVYTMVRLAVSC